jgi:uncharacterized membrane protein
LAFFSCGARSLQVMTILVVSAPRIGGGAGCCACMTTEPERPSPTETGEPESAGDSLVGRLLAELLALRAFAEHYISAKIDIAAVHIRRFWSRILIGCLIGAMVLFLAGTFVIYLVRGIDGGLVAVFEREWLGHLVTGGAGLFTIASVIKLAMINTERRYRDRSIERFERRKAREREEVGRDVQDTINTPE